jgi:endoglucanase
MLSKRIIFIMLISSMLISQVTPPFTRGVNLTGWLQRGSAQQVQFTQYTYEDFVDIQSLGVDVIRLPINLHPMTSGSPDYSVDPLLFFFLDQIIDWTEELDLHLILDNHTFDPSVNTDVGVYPILSAVWPQIAERYADRGPNLYYEILNEPHGIDDLVWNTIQQNIVNAIRAVDTTHTIIVGPAGWNSMHNLDDMPIYTDDNLIYTFHFYDPFLFTHQGASWTDPSMVSLAGVPFPYAAGDMPACPPDLVGTWIQTELNNYASTGTVAALHNTLDIAIAFSEARNVPIFCGEFGAYIPNSDNEDRVEYYGEVVQYMDSMNVAWTMWDYHGGFGLYEAGGFDLFDHDLNIPLVEALGFNVPEQTPYELVPDSGNIEIYGDFILDGIIADHNSHGEMNLFSTDNPRRGDFCISWSEASQYDRIGFKFAPFRDLSTLLEDGFQITFWIRPSGTPRTLDLRFVDTKNAIPEDHPWRMSFAIEANQLQWNDQWQYVQIPLSAMAESGSWDNAWYEPMGLFEWESIQTLEFVAEREAFTGTTFSIDEIRIVDAQTASLKPEFRPKSMGVEQNYPNPFNNSTMIPFHLEAPAHIKVELFDIQGRHVLTLAQGEFDQGHHVLPWSGQDSRNRELATGIYLVRLSADESSEFVKISLLR